MPDVLADGRFGEDHGIICSECGAETFLIDDQGYGLMSYECRNGHQFSIQYEFSDDDDDDDDSYYFGYQDVDYMDD